MATDVPKGKRKGDFMWNNLYHTIRELKNGWNWEGSLDIMWSNPSASAESPADSCSRPCPDGFHVSLRIEIPSTTLLGKLCQFSVTLTIKIFFLVFIRNTRMMFQIVPISSCPWLGITEKSLAPSSLHLPFRYLYIFMKYPLNFLFTMPDSSISHNFPLCKWCPNPLVTAMGLHWSSCVVQ